MKITVSIVLYNTKKSMLQKAIDSILLSSFVDKIYLLDNSQEKTFYPFTDTRIEYIFNNENLGYSKGHNLILNAPNKRGKYHLVMNPDILFNTNVLDKLFEFMEKNLNIGLVMPKILNPDGSIQYQCKLLPTPFNIIARRFLPAFLYEKSNKVFEMRSSGYNKQMEVPYLNGSFMFLRSSVLNEIKGFDENIFMYGEDLDLSRRIYEYSSAVFFPEVSVVHEHQKGSFKNFKLLLIHCKGMIYYFNKWGWLFDKKRREINKIVKKKYLTN